MRLGQNVLVALAMALTFVGCGGEDQLPKPPKDRPVFPDAMAQSGDFLALISSNSNKAYRSGGLLLLDLNKVDQALDENKSYISNESGIIADFISAPSLNGDLVWLKSDTLVSTSRIDQTLFFATAQQGKLTSKLKEMAKAKNTAEGEEKDILTDMLGAPERNPYHVAQLFGYEDKVIVGFLSSGTLNVVDLSKAKEGEGRIEKVIHLVDALRLHPKRVNNDEVFSPIQIRALQVVPDIHGLGPHVFMLVEYTDTLGQGIVKGSTLIWVKQSDLLKDGPEVVLSKEDIGQFNLSGTTGASSCFNMKIVPEKARGYILLREPYGIAQIELLKTESETLQTRFMNVQSTCNYPADIVYVSSLDSLYVSCYGSDSIMGFDATTLEYQNIDRFFGRGPFRMWLDKREKFKEQNQRLYVNFYLDGSVGVYDIDKDSKKLIRAGRIFSQAPRNLDGGL